MHISHVLLFLTYKCNLRCSFCLSFNNYWQPEAILNIPIAKVENEMTTDDIIKRVIPQCVENNVEVIALSGGEILIRKDIELIFQELGKANIRWCFDSNLMLCTKSIAKTVIEASCNAVFVSIDGTREIHNKLRCNPNAYDSCIDGLQNLIQAKNEVKTSNTQIIINCVIQPGNEHVPTNIVNIANKYEIEEVSFQLLSEWNYNKVFLSKVAYEAIEQANEIAKEYGITISCYPLPNPIVNDLDNWFSEKKPNVFFNGCDYINHNLRIDPQGNVIPCIEYNMGNILKKNLLDIWRSKEYQIFRNQANSYDGYNACLRCCNMTTK